MSIEYILITKDGRKQSLNDPKVVSRVQAGSMTQGDDLIKMDYESLEGKSMPGIVPLSQTIVNKRMLKISLTFVDDVSSSFIDQVNALCSACAEAVKVESNGATASIRCKSMRVRYGDGQLKIGAAGIEATFDFIDPFWERNLPTTTAFSVPAGATILIPDTVEGFVPVGSRLELTASAPTGTAVTALSFWRRDTNEAIEIKDREFGQNSGDVLTIDCRRGTVELFSSLYIRPQPRNDSIVTTTGFFPSPIVSSMLAVYNSGPPNLSGVLTTPVLSYV